MLDQDVLMAMLSLPLMLATFAFAWVVELSCRRLLIAVRSSATVDPGVPDVHVELLPDWDAASLTELHNAVSDLSLSATHGRVADPLALYGHEALSSDLWVPIVLDDHAPLFDEIVRKLGTTLFDVRTPSFSYA